MDSISTQPWQLEYIWKYFELHVNHRATMLNYLLVASGFFAYAYAEIDSNGERAAVSLFAAVSAFSFLCLDGISLRKIQNAKAHLVLLVRIDLKDAPADPLVCVLGGTPDRLDEGFISKGLLSRDPLWTSVIEGGLAAVFTGLGVNALLPASLPLWERLLIVGVTFLPVSFCSWLVARHSICSTRMENLLSLCGKTHNPAAPTDQKAPLSGH